MNLFKDSLFSSLKRSSRKKSKQSNRYQFQPYRFRQATSTSTDPLHFTFENDHIELDTLDSDEESPSERQQRIRTRRLHRPVIDAGGSIIIVEKPVNQDESIQAFAIRYRVPVRYSFILFKRFNALFVHVRFLRYHN
jgi:hypothetical protein